MEKLLHERLRELENWCQLYERYNIREVSFTKLMESFADEIERYYIPRPRFEDGEPVQFGDLFAGNNGEECDLTSVFVDLDGFYKLNSCPEYYELHLKDCNHFVKRPAPKVYDADGVPCKPNDEVWSTSKEGLYEEGDMMIVVGIDAGVKERQVLVRRALGGAGECWVNSEYLTHERPVFDADGVRCKDAETVYRFDEVRGILPEPCVIEKVTPDGTLWWKTGGCAPAYMYTHREPDSFEKLRDDIRDCRGGFVEWSQRLTALIERGA